MCFNPCYIFSLQKANLISHLGDSSGLYHRQQDSLSKTGRLWLPLSADRISKGWSVCVNSGWGDCLGGRFALRSSDRRADLQALDSHSPALVRHESGQGLCVLSCLKVYLGTRKKRGVDLCKLNWWTSHLFPQPVQRGKYSVSGHLMGLTVDFLNMASTLANLGSKWNLFQQPAPNSVFSNTPLRMLPSIFILSFCSSAAPQTMVPHLEVACSRKYLKALQVFSPFSSLFLQSTHSLHKNIPFSVSILSGPFPQLSNLMTHSFHSTNRWWFYYLSCSSFAFPSGKLVVGASGSLAVRWEG